MSESLQSGSSQNLDLVFARATRRRLVRQAAFCDPQISQYSAVLENGFPTSQQRLEVLRGPQSSGVAYHLEKSFSMSFKASLIEVGRP